jgi:hypothetical protein
LDGLDEAADAEIIDNSLVVAGCPNFDVELVEKAVNPGL